MRVCEMGLALLVLMIAACSQQESAARGDAMAGGDPQEAAHAAMDRRPDNQDDEGPATESEGWAEYPRAIRGEWVEQEVGCPINYDSESFLSIESGLLGQYENTSRARDVQVLAEHPQTWLIESAFSSGTGEYEGAEGLVFKLDGATLVIGSGDSEKTYIRCE